MSRPLSIVMPIASFAPKIGGAEKQAQLLGRELVERGSTVTVLTRRYPGLAATTTVDGIFVRRFRIAGDGRNRLSSILFTVGVIAWLVKHRSEYDVVHAHQAFSQATAAVLAGALTGRPVLVKIAGSGPDGDVDRIRRRSLAGLRPTLLRRVDRFLALSEATRTELLEIGVDEDRIVSIVNGVDTEYLSPGPDRAGDRVTVLFVGRLHPVKGLDVLLEAWRTLYAGLGTAPSDAPRGPRLLIVGDGAERAGLEEMARFYGISDSVEFAGFKDDVRPYLIASDMLVLPSRAEGLPNAMLEAMSCGLPVVASEVGGIPEVVRDDKEGKLVPAGDAQRLSEALAILVNDPNLRGKLGRTGRKTVQERFSVDALCNAHMTIYEQVV